MTSTRPEIAVPATAPHPQADPERARRTYELDRAHVFHSWSAQAALTPLVVAGGAGLLGLGRRRHHLPRLLRPARLHQPRLRAPGDRARDPGAGGDARDRRPAARERRPLRGRPPHRRAGAGFSAGQRALQPRVLHQRRRGRDRERRPDGPPAHRPPQGARPLPQLPRQHHDGDQPDRGSAAVAQRLRHRGSRPLLRALPVPVGVPRHHRAGGVRARPGTPRADDPARGAGDDRRDRARVHPRDRRDHDPAAGVPRRRPRAVRPLRDPLDRRRGDERVRPRRPVVRLRARGRRRRARSRHLREGRELGIRAARRGSRLACRLRHVRASGRSPAA